MYRPEVDPDTVPVPVKRQAQQWPRPETLDPARKTKLQSLGQK